jgi:hypothetical protein
MNNNIEFDIDKISERLLKLEDENENLKVQVKQLKEFGEEEVRQNGRLARWIESLRKENERLKKN